MPNQNKSGRANARVRLLTRPEMLAATGLSFPQIWEMMRVGKFPQPCAIGKRSLWRSDEIQAWMDALPRRQYKPVKGAEQVTA